MDYRLSRWKDDNGQVWQICQICTEETRYEDLAIDKANNLRWDICATCEHKEFNQIAHSLIEKLMPHIPPEYRAGFEGMMVGGEYAMAIDDLVALVEDYHIELSSTDTETLRDLNERSCAPGAHSENAPHTGTSGGIELTDEVVQRLADEAEQGYPTEHLRPHREGPPTLLRAGSSSRNERNTCDHQLA